MRQDQWYQLYRDRYINAPKLNLTFPIDVSLELSSFCTNSCGYCYHASPKTLPFKRGKMSAELAIKVINEAHSLGVNSLKWNYRGEATMNDDFEKIVSYAESLAYGPVFIDRILNSNFNFDKDREDIFRGLLKQTKVKVSFDSFKKDIFEKQRRGSRYERTLLNMYKFHDDPKRTTKMVIQSVRTQLNKDENLEDEIKKRFPDAIASIRNVVAGRVNNNVEAMEVKTRDFSNRQSCIQAHARVIVNWDGKVQMCCPDISTKLVIGDATKENLHHIWNSSKAKEIRQSLLNKKAFDLEPCKTCPSFESYSGYVAPMDS